MRVGGNDLQQLFLTLIDATCISLLFIIICHGLPLPPAWFVPSIQPSNLTDMIHVCVPRMDDDVRDCRVLGSDRANKVPVAHIPLRQIFHK